ncbi:MAG: translational GTPase TypA [Clostridia bacterium]|jgi:GTP-binding protein|nr:translational GTPase TypA [Clostridia bacterium]MDD3231773.1 translational GTPase TypA [Clostridia bacterium]MDD3862530.1 translational GTPase TypA [Clostridia bacterium]MDD4408574.1 translational GTPase TypA [Clostridia bacterium]
MENQKIRNIAIIAHVDHGKTSLVNEMLKQGGVFRENQIVEDRVMDSNDLERERGITIFSKNASLFYKNTKINVVDTPGHADFGGEVERVLKMVDGVLLVVDAYEGPMPQTRFVLEKAITLNLNIIVVINKIDRKDSRITEVCDEVLELFIELGATNEQLNSPFVYASAKNGTASLSATETGENMIPLFDTVLNHISAPSGDENKPFRMLVSSTEQNDFLGKLAVGKIEQGKLNINDNLIITNYFDSDKKINFKVQSLFEFQGLKRVQVETADVGDIICIAGAKDMTIGDTLSDKNEVVTLPFVKISEPNVEMTFMVNTSPLAGKEGKYCTSRHLKERLFKEAVKDLSLRVFETDKADSFRVLGRGEMHLSILMENLRREGYEFQVSMTKVVYKIIDGKTFEPIEKLVVDVPSDKAGNVISVLGARKAEMTNMNSLGTRTKIEFLIPARGLFGYKNQFLTDTNGEGIMSSVFYEYQEFKGNLSRKNTRSLIAFESGNAVQYGLFNSQEHGRLIVFAGETVYAGMIVGFTNKPDDIVVNVCKTKHLTNTRSSASDEALRLEPIQKPSLEQMLDLIGEDELLEVTPKTLRLRKIILDHTIRGRMNFRKKKN